MISAGVLFSFNLTNTSLVVVRRGRFDTRYNNDNDKSSRSQQNPCASLLVAFHVVAIVLAGLVGHVVETTGEIKRTLLLFHLFIAIFSAVLLCLAIAIYLFCPENPDPNKSRQYRVSYMPFVPLLGIIINYILIAQLSNIGLILILVYLGLASVYYFTYCLAQSDAVVLRYAGRNPLLPSLKEDNESKNSSNNNSNNNLTPTELSSPDSNNTIVSGRRNSNDVKSPMW